MGWWRRVGPARSRAQQSDAPIRADALGVVALAAVTLLMAGCGGGSRAAASSSPAARSLEPTSKVMLVVEENKPYEEILGPGTRAPYLAGLAKQYGSATAMDAGYPTRCPSLAAYIIMTSGYGTHICDDRPPSVHARAGTSVFGQVAASGRQWRSYAESMPANCTLDDAAPTYLVRHSPVAYYLDVRPDCARWHVPLGTPTAGALHDDLAAGRLPAFSFVTPDACNDMHGAPSCRGNLVATGDAWLRTWVPKIVASRDFTSGRLAVLVTFDEGDDSTNHIPMVVLSARTRNVVTDGAFTHCSTLRTVQDVLGLDPTGCAVAAPSMRSAFRL